MESEGGEERQADRLVRNAPEPDRPVERRVASGAIGAPGRRFDQLRFGLVHSRDPIEEPYWPVGLAPSPSTGLRTSTDLIGAARMSSGRASS